MLREFRFVSLVIVLVCYGQAVVAQDINVPDGKSEGTSDVLTVRYPNFTGKWQSLQWNLDVWNLDFTASGTKLTGTISLSPSPDRPKARDLGPVEIYDGTIDKNSIEFKIKSPDNMRVITYSGSAVRGGIQFTRKMEIQPGAGSADEGIFSSVGPLTFTAKSTPRISKKARHIDQ